MIDLKFALLGGVGFFGVVIFDANTLVYRWR